MPRHSGGPFVPPKAGFDGQTRVTYAGVCFQRSPRGYYYPADASDPQTLKIGTGSIIFPGVNFGGLTNIGKLVVVGPDSSVPCPVGNGSVIGARCAISMLATVGQRVTMGDDVHVRYGVRVYDDACIPSGAIL